MNPKEFEERFRQGAIKIENDIKKRGYETIQCLKCHDSGFVWVLVETVSAWAYCRCSNGKDKSKGNQWSLPDYEYDMERLYSLKPFPLKAFIPSPFEKLSEGMNRKMRDFKNDLKLSERFWKEYVYKNEK